MKAWEAFDVATVSKTSEVLYDLARKLIAERPVAPLDQEVDPVNSLLAATDAEGPPLPDAMLVGCVRQILVVGLVAPPVFLGSIAVHFSRYPDLADELRARPEAIEDAVEEFLSLYTTRPIAASRGPAATASNWADSGSSRASQSRSFMPRPIATKRCSTGRTNCQSHRAGRPGADERHAGGRAGLRAVADILTGGGARESFATMKVAITANAMQRMEGTRDGR